jgi:hypothetical protein
MKTDMTRDEFARYCWEGSQWTPAKIAAVHMAQSGFLPKSDAETFERELLNLDGYIEVERMPPIQPLFGDFPKIPIRFLKD